MTFDLSSENLIFSEHTGRCPVEVTGRPDAPAQKDSSTHNPFQRSSSSGASSLTCAGGGLQRRFLSGAGGKLPDGLFFNTMTTPPDSALSFSTRCFNCQPTWTNQRPELFTALAPVGGAGSPNSGQQNSWRRSPDVPMRLNAPRNLQLSGCCSRRARPGGAELTTVCWLTWTSSSPAWTLRVLSAGD